MRSILPSNERRRNKVDRSLIKEQLVKGDAQGMADGIRDALAEEVSAETILNEILIPGMEEVGDLFARGEYFVPELLFSARAMTGALEILRPYLVDTGYEPAGKVVMGTVQGDLHDIGKNLVSVMLEGSGFEIVDLGSSVAPQRFVEAAKESGAKLVGLSALLTTTLPAMEETVRAVHEAELPGDVRVMVGGAPLTASYAEQIGADGYAADASSAAALARRLVNLPAGQSSTA
jgi:5-methyltetrahydrofolate--homocysteine methyltransferase